MNTALTVYTAPAAALAIPRQAYSDSELIRIWLHNKARHTRRAYQHDADLFTAFVCKPLTAVTLSDLQAFADSLTGGGLAESSQGRTIAAMKSLFSFAAKVGYIRFNPGAAIQAPKTKCALAERILQEADVQRMLALETHPRNAAILRLLYGAGLRVSELCGLHWRDVQARRDAGQVVAYGKGGKTRSVLLSAGTWAVLVGLQGNASPDVPVFRSQKGGGAISACMVLRIVRRAAARAGITARVSPHWMRHAHASHSLERGCPISLVQATLGHSSVATTGRYLHARPNDSSGRYLAV